MTVVETVLVYGGIPLGIYAGLAVPTLGLGRARRARYRPGQVWTYDPVWWTAHSAGADLPELPAAQSVRGAVDGTRSAQGGARGSW